MHCAISTNVKGQALAIHGQSKFGQILNFFKFKIYKKLKITKNTRQQKQTN